MRWLDRGGVRLFAAVTGIAEVSFLRHASNFPFERTMLRPLSCHLKSSILPHPKCVFFLFFLASHSLPREKGGVSSTHRSGRRGKPNTATLNVVINNSPAETFRWLADNRAVTAHRRQGGQVFFFFTIPVYFRWKTWELLLGRTWQNNTLGEHTRTKGFFCVCVCFFPFLYKRDCRRMYVGWQQYGVWQWFCFERRTDALNCTLN